VFHVLSESKEQDKEDKGDYHIQASERKFSTSIVNLWVSMAATGKPAAAGLPAWPKYDDKTSSCPALPDDLGCCCCCCWRASD